MILYFRVCTCFTAGPNIKWDVLHALQFCTGRYSYGYSRLLMMAVNFYRRRGPSVPLEVAVLGRLAAGCVAAVVTDGHVHLRGGGCT